MDQPIIKLEGIFPPIPTPFDSNGEIAFDKLGENIQWLSAYDLNGFVILGSNGEAVLLKEKEKEQIWETARQVIPPDKLMIAGTGCQSTQETVELTQMAAAHGADVALVLNPHYYRNQMTTDAFVHHYHTIADNVSIPLLVYNMPAATGIDIDAVTISGIAEHVNIIGLKDSSGNITKMSQIRQLVGPAFQIIAGSASFFLPALSAGAVAGIMALANIAPLQCLHIYRFFLDKKFEEAQDLQTALVALNQAVTRDWGVPALKAAMDMLGLYGGPVRMPLLPISEEIKRELRTIIQRSGIIKLK